MLLFRENGYEATTVQEIAEAADISYRTFFRYFATKEDTVFPDIDRHLEHFQDRLGAIPSGTHPWPVIRQGLIEVIDRFEEAGPGFSVTTMRVWIEDPGMAGPFARFNRKWSLAIAQAWRDHTVGVDRDRLLAAEICGHITVGAMIAAFRVYLEQQSELRGLVEAALDRIEPLLSLPAD